MYKPKVTHIPSLVLVLSLCLIGPNHWLMTAANAQQLDRWQLDRSYKIERGPGSRLPPVSQRNCRYCQEKERDTKFEYLKRVLTEQGSSSYQNKIESMIFTDAKFVNGCWKNAYDKGIEIFFTINESGEASDFAWFPKHKAGKCIKRYISKIEFPGIEKPHHAWIVASTTTK